MPAKIIELYHHLRNDQIVRKTQALAQRTRQGKSAKSFISQPAPRGVGSALKGLHLAAGNFLVDGDVIKDPIYSIWDIGGDSSVFQKTAHGFSWIDHLAANGSRKCQSKTRLWFADWLARYGDGDTAVWTPELAGSRLIRMLNHAIILLGNPDELSSADYFASISHHARFLRKSWRYAPNGLPRFQALVGCVYSTLALEEFALGLKPALRRLAKECEVYVDKDGGILTRNPEELLDIFTLLVWVDQGMTVAGYTPDRGLLRAIERIAPALRTLRLGDGKLVEFHGGASSDKERIRQILLDSGARETSTFGQSMGYSRLENGASVVVMDTGPAPKQNGRDRKCGCALAFEFSSGAHPIFRSVGCGRDHGQALEKAGHVTSAFSVGSVQQVFTPKVGRTRNVSAGLAANTDVTLLDVENPDVEGDELNAQHNGYKDAFGLTYTRALELTSNGRVLSGRDRFHCSESKDQAILDIAVSTQGMDSIAFDSRFHVSPDVKAELDLGGSAVSLLLPNNEVWIFKASGGMISLAGSAHFESDRLKPRATKQIVVKSQVVNYEGAVTWMLTRLEG